MKIINFEQVRTSFCRRPLLRKRNHVVGRQPEEFLYRTRQYRVIFESKNNSYLDLLFTSRSKHSPTRCKDDLVPIVSIFNETFDFVKVS